MYSKFETFVFQWSFTWEPIKNDNLPSTLHLHENLVSQKLWGEGISLGIRSLHFQCRESGFDPLSGN